MIIPDLDRIEGMTKTTKSKPKDRAACGRLKRLVMWFFPSFFKERHIFDMENPIIKGTGIWTKNKNGVMTQAIVKGYKCEKCGHVLWLDKWQIQSLPKSMSWCNT